MGLYFNIALFLPFNNYEGKEVILKGYVIEKDENQYIIYVKRFDKYTLIKEIKIKLYVETKLNIGDEIILKGEYSEGEVSRNYKGFSYRNYLKQNSIYGIVSVEENNIKIISQKVNFNTLISKLKYKLSFSVSNLYDGEIVGFMQSLLFGNKTNLDDSLNNLFKECSISHVLAISGMHVGIILITVDKLLEKILKHKRLKYILEIMFLIFFYIITGMQVSCFRSVLFNILSIINILKYDRNDIVKNVLITYVILICFNIYNVINIGLYLSFFSSISIMVFNKFINKIIKIKNKFLLIFKSDFVVSISAQILIFPILIYSFNFFSLNFILTNLIISICISWILKFGYLTVILELINIYDLKIIEYINNFFVIMLSNVLKIIFKILDFISNLKFLNLRFCTPSFLFLIIWYLVIIFIIKIFIENKYKFYKIMISKKRRKNFFYDIKSNLVVKNISKQNKRFIILICVLLLCLVLNNICVYFSSKGFKIYFIDVGQGDCSLIKTNLNKTILIDSGEGESDKTNKGEKVVYPYLLDRKIKSLDYVILSHFDSDHAGGIVYILDNMEVKNLIIGIQTEESNLFEKVIEKVKEKNINLIVIDNPRVLKIDDVYLDFIWPIKDNLISENKLNNNSLVFRVIYKDFKMMFTGDIEEPAEKEIVRIYKDNKTRLYSDILKLAHHGSKTSTTDEFLKLVNPKSVVIGVGKNNSFNHPSEEIINKLLKNNIKIYRTDLNGEIIIGINKYTNKIKIRKILE